MPAIAFSPFGMSNTRLLPKRRAASSVVPKMPLKSSTPIPVRKMLGSSSMHCTVASLIACQYFSFRMPVTLSSGISPNLIVITLQQRGDDRIHRLGQRIDRKHVGFLTFAQDVARPDPRDVRREDRMSYCCVPEGVVVSDGPQMTPIRDLEVKFLENFTSNTHGWRFSLAQASPEQGPATG